MPDAVAFFQSETLQALLTAAVDGIVTIDLRGRITSFNRAAERMFGYSVNDVMGRNVKCLMPNPFAKDHDAYIAHYQTTGERKIIGIGRRVAGLKKDGARFPIELSVGEIKHEDDSVGYIGIIRDISQTVQAEEDAKENREQLAHVTRLSTMGEMAAGIAHEVNQPLTAIASYAQACRRLMLRGDQNLDKVLDVLEKIDAQALRASDVIKKLRRFVKKQEEGFESVDCSALLEDTLALARTDTRLLEYPLTLSVSKSLLPVLADAVQIQQVLLNLIRNGVDATEALKALNGESVGALGMQVFSEQHPLAIQVFDHDNTHLEVVVSDCGLGVDESIKDRLFHPFQTTKSSGMGIGLCVSRSIIRAHGGELWYQAPEKGSGAEFHFTLPYYH